ncbi:MAG: maleylacetoacetate isomerase, partial [Gammaproteobacteria bacterium]|nr:maleylacetoacetate isomerase [Gammaproteobacteria bacterium]MDH5629476.1 maleylacetoacetate isomerase [Gammaproteobacteria bacterium]
MIKLYSYWRSTAAYRVRIALNLKQVSYSLVPVNLIKDGGEHKKPEYLQKNPQGLVPLLDDDGKLIGQSMAIMEYLEEKYSQVPLLPEDLRLRALARQLCQVIVSDLHPLNNLRVLGYLTENLKVSEEEKMKWYFHWMEKGFKAFDELLKNVQIEGDYCLGEELSLADACLIPQIYNANR